MEKRRLNVQFSVNVIIESDNVGSAIEEAKRILGEYPAIGRPTLEGVWDDNTGEEIVVIWR